MNYSIRLKISEQEVSSLMDAVSHPTFQNARSNNWAVKDGCVRTKNFCWLFCWAKTGLTSPAAKHECEEIFDKIFTDYTYQQLDALGVEFHEWARRARVSNQDELNDSQLSSFIHGDFTPVSDTNDYTTMNKIKDLLEANYNVILTGAPGTGKTFLAKQIAEEMGATEQEGNLAFVQFHPSYDYTDFVEGLRPTSPDGSGNVGFERTDGVFKAFCAKALDNLQKSRKDEVELSREEFISSFIDDFMNEALENHTEFTTSANRNNFFITDIEEDKIVTKNNGWAKDKVVFLSKNLLLKLLTSNEKYTFCNEMSRQGLGRKARRSDYYLYVLYSEMLKELETYRQDHTEPNYEKVPEKKFVFIIDEINRGEISKIFGELFFSIDAGYRGEQGKVLTQYANMSDDSDVFKDGFFVPENVYIIGTMNDIDRSVESFDFAMRRRFTWDEITAEESAENMSLDVSVRAVMNSLNRAISGIAGLGSAYHIGGAYYLKLKGNDYESLWKLHLEPLLKEYLRGTPDSEQNLKKLKDAYYFEPLKPDEDAEDDGQ